MNTNVVTKTDEKKQLNFFQVMKNKIFGGEADNMMNMVLIGVGILVFLILLFLIYKKVTSGGEDTDTMSLNTTPDGDNDSNDSNDN